MQMMGQQQLNVNIAALQYILQSLLNLSLEQEKLVTATEETENRLAFVEMARQQQRIEQVFNSWPIPCTNFPPKYLSLPIELMSKRRKPSNASNRAYTNDRAPANSAA